MSTSESLFLKPNVQIEPLFASWYAWSYLIPPATAACNLTDRYVKIMESYLAAPEVHASAVKNPKMLGGPFIDLDGQRVDDVRRLLAETKQVCGRLLALRSDLAQVDALLRTNAKGFSLHPLYAQILEDLKGYIELMYDLNNQASFRIIEPLIYRSSYYDPSLQNLRFSIINRDSRPFVLSTPRLDGPGSVRLPWAFADNRIDDLCRLKANPESLSEIRDTLGFSEQHTENMRRFFTADLPRPYQPYRGEGMRWRYFGHGCILIETKTVSIIVDPVLSYTYEADISRYTYEDLPNVIDYVLITHNHQDHILFETMLQLRHKVRNIIVPRNGSGALQDPSLKLILENTGFRNVFELPEMESVSIDDGVITALPFMGEHCDLAVQSKLAYLVRLGKLSVLFAADSCNLEPKLYSHLHKDIGDVQVLFLGMECDGAPVSWLYGPLCFKKMDRTMDYSRRLNGSNCEQAIQMVDALRCKHVYVYAMGQEPWLNYIMSIKYTEQSRPIVESNRLIKECVARGMVSERLYGEKEVVL